MEMKNEIKGMSCLISILFRSSFSGGSEFSSKVDFLSMGLHLRTLSAVEVNITGYTVGKNLSMG